MANGIVTTESIKADIDAIRDRIRDRAERIANCEVEDTDCFLSAASDSTHIWMLEKQLEIIENGGTDWFVGYATLDGELVDARLVDTRYGTKLVADMPNGETVWTTAKTEKGLAKKGLKRVMVRKAAWVKVSGWKSIHTYQAKLNRATGAYDEGVLEVAEYDWND